MVTEQERREAQEEQMAREKGRSIPHYGKKVGKTLAAPKKRGKLTPPKRG